MPRMMWPLLLLPLLPTICLAQPRPVLTISFDRDLNGAGVQGVVAGAPEGKPELAPGKVGQALRSGPGTGYVNYPVPGLVSTRAGTVEMWVFPLDWTPADEEFHVFFDVRGEGALYLYKYYQGINLLMLSCPAIRGPHYSADLPLNWQPGQWHHLAGTWSSRGVMAYVDGQPLSPNPVPAALPISLGETFRIGDGPWHLPRKSSSLVDEVRLYDRALTAEHIAAHYRGDFSATVALNAKTAGLRYDLDPERGQATAYLSTGGADVSDQTVGATVALTGKGQAPPADATAVTFEEGEARQVFPLPSQQPGEYDVVARFSLAGQPQFELRRSLVIPETAAWMGNRIGMEDVVLPPWTPVQLAAGPVVKVWGRDYRFGGGLLPAQISSAGADLLARPMQLRASADGKPVTLALRPAASAVQGSDTRARVVRAARGTVGGQALVLRAVATTEYDGVMVLTLSGTIPPGVDTLSLDIPVRQDRAIYRHRWAPTWAGVSGNLPAGQGVVDRASFIPYYWLGDNDRGLFWFCESDEFWPNGRSDNALEIVRQGQEVVLRLNLLAKGQKLPTPWTFTCGLQATPVKPLPRDWRRWRLSPGRNPNVFIHWPRPAADSLRYYGYPEPANPELFTKYVAGIHEQKAKVVPYSCLTYLSAASPEWAYFRKFWEFGGGDAGSSDVAAYGATFAMASPLGKHYADFIIWKNKQFIERYGLDGVYHDQTHPYASSNLAAGCGYMRDGQPQPTYPILAYRNLYRRLYSVVKSQPRETFTMAHMSGKVTIPILAYEDSYLDGENFRGLIKDSYLDLISLDTFRAEYMGRQWGVMPYFLPMFPTSYARQVEPTRGLMALLMLHDTALWLDAASVCNLDVANEALAALDEFGYVDAEFLPYFDPQPPATTAMKDVLVSGYRRADGAVLLIVGNLSKEDRQGVVTLNAQRLGHGAMSVATWPDRQPVTADQGRVELAVPRLGYRMLLVAAAK